jgi:hypothetical protein
MAPNFLDLIEDVNYFNEPNFLYVRYLLHLDHTTKKSKKFMYIQPSINSFEN